MLLVVQLVWTDLIQRSDCFLLSVLMCSDRFGQELKRLKWRGCVLLEGEGGGGN